MQPSLTAIFPSAIHHLAKAERAKYQQKQQVTGSTTAVFRIVIIFVFSSAIVAGIFLTAFTSQESGNRIDIRVGEASKEAHGTFFANCFANLTRTLAGYAFASPAPLPVVAMTSCTGRDIALFAGDGLAVQILGNLLRMDAAIIRETLQELHARRAVREDVGAED